MTVGMTSVCVRQMVDISTNMAVNAMPTNVGIQVTQ